MSRWFKGILLIAVVLGLHSAAQGATITRPIEDFLKAQGTYDIGYIAVPPDPNFLGFGTMLITPETNPDRGWSKKATDYVIRFTGTDYAGLAKEAYTSSGLPEITGTVIDRPLPDGRTEVTVVMHTKGANVWVIELDYQGDVTDQIANKPTLFGHRPRDVAAGAGQALGNCLLHVVFIVDQPQGVDLPDLIQVVYDPAPGMELKLLDFSTQAQGPLTEKFGVPEGTPGKCTITETGLIEVTGKLYQLKGQAAAHSRVAFDAFPVENIDLKVIGK
jgi:hypothetical protein